MNLRLADMNDLSKLIIVYKKIINDMDKNNIRIWDEIYPCDFFVMILKITAFMF